MAKMNIKEQEKENEERLVLDQKEERGGKCNGFNIY